MNQYDIIVGLPKKNMTLIIVIEKERIFVLFIKKNN